MPDREIYTTGFLGLAVREIDNIRAKECPLSGISVYTDITSLFGLRLGDCQSCWRCRYVRWNAIDGCLLDIDQIFHPTGLNHNLLLVRIRKVNCERVAYSRNRVYKSIRKLGPQHGGDLLASALEGLAERISSVSPLRAHMTRNAAVNTRVSERITPIEFKELGHMS